MDEIRIDGIKLYGRHGCFAFEREEKGCFEVSLKLRLDLSKAAESDELTDTIDYPAAMAVAQEVIEGGSVRLIEKLADKIAKRLFESFPKLFEVEVEVAKLGVEVGFDFSRVSASIVRRADFYCGKR